MYSLFEHVSIRHQGKGMSETHSREYKTLTVDQRSLKATVWSLFSNITKGRINADGEGFQLRFIFKKLFT